jgi:hypothetical protein
MKSNPQTKTIRVGDLKRDDDLWPRRLTRIDDTNLARIRDAIRAGEKLPPIRVCRKTLVIIDGYHRWTAYKGLFGEDHLIEVEMVDYDSKKDMLLDAVRMNSRHGMPMDSKDRTDTALRLRGLRATKDEICNAMAMTKEQYEKYMKRTATGSDGKPAALPWGANKLADQKEPLTKKQEEELPKIGGRRVASQARMLIAQIQVNAVDLENPSEVEVLVQLRDLLIKLLK